ncbi:MAG: hypothetical protein HY454_01935 [Parcubacteria group bacterium]|nr:hypothetical protein [Parcubacteria group bacterium]
MEQQPLLSSQSWRVIGEKLGDLGNVFFGAALLQRFVTGQSFSFGLLLFGFMSGLLLYFFAGRLNR